MFNALLGRGAAYSNLIKRLLSVHQGIEQVAPELQPSLVLESDASEWHYLAGEQLRAGLFSLAAGGAGFRSIAVLRNPAGSKQIITLENIMAHLGAGTTVIGGWEPAPPRATVAETVRAAMRDARWGRTLANGRVFTSNGVALGAVNTFINGPPDTVIPVEVVIPPGEDFVLAGNADNAALDGCFLWKERPLYELEG